VEPFTLRRPIAAAYIDKSKSAERRRIQAAECLSQPRKKRNLRIRREVPTGMKLQAAQLDMRAPTSLVNKRRKIGE
jgi:hypothetical protein